jgi:hypothetical protein
MVLGVSRKPSRCQNEWDALVCHYISTSYENLTCASVSVQLGFRGVALASCPAWLKY